MPTKAELIKSTGLYFHAFNRGVDRQPIFFREEDYAFFLRLVPAALEGLELVILSFCLMPNHFHFEMLQNQAYAMSIFFKRLCERYAKATNAFYGRVGHLFQRDYVPKLVPNPESVPWLGRYIDRNPVEAGLVKCATDWEYSSARDHCGLHTTPFLHSETFLQLAGGLERYCGFLNDSNGHPDKDSGRFLFGE
jgi:putative transposase